MSGAGVASVQVRAVRAARALAAASGREAVCAALDAAAAHLDEGTAAGAAGAYVVAREARLAVGTAAPGPLADALDVALAVINAARLGDAVRLPPNPGPLPSGYELPATYMQIKISPADVIAIIDPEAAAAAPSADRGDCPAHPGQSGLRRGCRECVAEEIAAADASAIVRALAAADPNFRGHDPQHECVFCGVLGATNPAGHATRCPWARSRAWVAAHDADPDPEPPLYDEPGGEPWQGKP